MTKTILHKTVFLTETAPLAQGDEPSLTISTANVDRDGDVIEPNGAVLGPYLKNPIVAFQHMRAEYIPVGTTTKLEIVPGVGLKAWWRWLKGDPLADRVRNAWSQGVLRAASIGFMPLAWEPMPGGGKRFTKWELTEWSIVAVPSNRQSVRALRQLGLWGGDDVLLTFDTRDLNRAIGNGVASALGEVVGEAVRNEIARKQGRLIDPEPVLMLAPAASRARRASQAVQFVGITRAQVERVAREQLPELIKRALRDGMKDAIALGIRQAQGRLD